MDKSAVVCSPCAPDFLQAYGQDCSGSKLNCTCYLSSRSLTSDTEASEDIRDHISLICIWLGKQTQIYLFFITIKGINLRSFSSVQLLSCVWLFATSWTAACQASLSITNSQSLLKLMFIEFIVMPSNHHILCHPFLLLPSVFPSNRVFSNESALRIRWSKYWSFNFNISPSNEHPVLISFRMDCCISFQSKGLSRVLSNTTVQMHQFFDGQLSLSPTLTSIHDQWKNHSLD